MGATQPAQTMPDRDAAPPLDMAAHLLDAAPVGMLAAASDGTITYFNRAFRDLLGCPDTAEPPLHLFDIVDEEDSTALRLQLERLARGEARTIRGEYRFRHADSNPVWVLFAASLAGPGQLVVQLTNIELQKKAEEALRYAEARWNSALENAGQGVWDYDLRRDRMFYSRMWRTMRGIPDGEDIGGTHESEWLDRIHPEDRERIRAIAARQGQGDDGHDTLEYRELARDGRYIWILSRGGPIEWDKDGNVLRAVGTDTDISHLKAIEMELAAQKKRLHVTLQAIADGVITTDTTGRVVFLNPVAEKLLGYSADEARGRPSSEIFVLRRAGSDEIQACPGKLCIQLGKIVDADEDLVLWTRSSGWRDIRCIASPVIMPDGTVTGSVLVFQDVTQSRALQRELEHSATHDALTGLTNRAAFERALDTAVATCQSTGRQACLVYIDLDHFKPVNDTAGHAAGDALLKQVALVIRRAGGPVSVAARIGGDEFAVLVADSTAEEGRRVADAIVDAIGALVFSWAGREYRIGASAGLTHIAGQPASPLGFMGEADAACYAAKAAGRGRSVLFERPLAQPQP